MSTTIEPEITLDDLNHFWSAEGLPVFYADRDDICDIVESIGFNIYYLLGNTATVKTPPVNKNNNTNNKYNSPPSPPSSPQTTREVTWFKVVNNFVGRTVAKCSPSLPEEFLDVSESAHYNMPLIPHVLVDKLDQFFRLVDAQHSTESIVMLTYDLDKEGPEGWGILVPDQQNTAAHCNYDPHSIAEMKPDNVMIVGSVHSHPHMAAYASGTDHADQADFDGIHITYGWQKSVNNGATQYHIELQMAGEAYTLKPEDVFENFTIDKQPDPDVVEWSTKVKKELPPYLGVPSNPSLNRHQPAGKPTPATSPGTHSSNFLTPSIYAYSKVQWHKEVKKSQKFNNFEDGAFYVVEYSKPYDSNQGEYCLVCDSYLDAYCFYDGLCDVCMVPLTFKETPKEQILEQVAEYASALKFTVSNPVYLVGTDDSRNIFAIKLCDNLSTYIKSETASATLLDNDDEDKLESYFEEEDYLLCCGIHVDDIATCFCEPQILYQHYIDFELDTRDIEIYDKDDATSKCMSCEHYYNHTCPAIKQHLVSYSVNKSNAIKNMQELDPADLASSHDCLNYEEYLVHTPYSGAYGYGE